MKAKIKNKTRKEMREEKKEIRRVSKKKQEAALHNLANLMDELNKRVDTSVDDIAEIEDLANGAVNVASESLNQAKAYTDEKVVQSDWNVNDEADPAFVKNRPFYTGNLTKQTLVSGTFYIESDEQ